MTLLDMVNQVLVRLRENQATSTTVGVLPPLISALVQDAYKIVEDSHDWSVLRETINVPTVIGQTDYELTDVPVDSNIFDVYYQNNRVLKRYSKEWVAQRKLYAGNDQNEPTGYYVKGANPTTGNLIIEVYPTPDAIYQLDVSVAKRGTVPTSDNDVLVIPTDPVLHMALAFATRERGETGGTSAQEYFGLADISLRSAIARDAAHRPDELILYTP